MPKLTLQFEGCVLKEFGVGKSVTIGRLPDNTVVIDNPAVSAHHARIFRDGDRVVLEDLKSTNGTFVNEHHVDRRVLRNGDAVLIGKHRLVFDAMEDTASHLPQPMLSPLGDTVYLDTKKHRALLATLRAARAEADKAVGALPTVSAPVAEGWVGVLRVVSGRAERPEYDLNAHTSLIGRSDGALVRLRGWFKPDVAVAIARNDDGYVATQFAGRTMVNSQPLRGRRHLREGDILSVGGLTLEFRLKRESESEPAQYADESRNSRFMSAGERAATFRALT
jgi:pSer/pThr/pTyr-binding forkhead associated (FHA) protein